MVGRIQLRAALTRSPLAMLAFAASIRLVFALAGYLNIDEGAHLVGAGELLHGTVYRTFFDNKPPLIYVWYALSVWLSSVTHIRAIHWVHITTTLGLWLIQVWAIGWASRWASAGSSQTRGDQKRWIGPLTSPPALLYALASNIMLAADAYAAHTEHLMLVPLTLCLGLALRPTSNTSLVAQGALVGIATLAKQPAALFVVVPGVGLIQSLVASRGAQSLASSVARVGQGVVALTIGASVPIVLCSCILSSMGVLDAAWYWSVTYNQLHIGNPVPFSEALQRALGGAALFAPAVLPAVMLLIPTRPHLPAQARYVLLAALYATGLPIALGLRFFGHYFIPLLAVVYVAAASATPDAPERQSNALGTAALLAGVFSVINVVAFLSPLATKLSPIRDARFQQVAACVRMKTRADDRLFVWGYAAPVYVESHRRPASGFVVPIDTVSGYVAGNNVGESVGFPERIRADHVRQLLSDLAQTQPRTIIDVQPANLYNWGGFPLQVVPALERYVRANYRVDSTCAGATVYRKNPPNAAVDHPLHHR